MRVVLAVLGGIVIWIGVMEIVIRLTRSRRRRQDVTPVSPKWLNENVYDKDGDRRWK